MIEGVKVAADLLRALWPLLDSSAKDLAVQFWGDSGLGPMPPDLVAWDNVDKRVDEALKGQ